MDQHERGLLLGRAPVPAGGRDHRRAHRLGEIPAGGAVPSVARLMQEFGIARTTAGKVLAYLQEQGRVKIVRGWGTFAVDQE